MTDSGRREALDASRRAEVRVILPTLGERLESLAETLQSISDQDVCTRVVMVVPRSAAAARRLADDRGILTVDDPGRGLSAAMNAGLLAPGREPYYAWLNDDDLLRPHGLRTLVAMMDANPPAPVVYGACDYIDPQGRLLGASRMGPWAARILSWGPDLVPMPSTLTRAADARAVGGYDERLRFAMDLDMLLRLRRRGPFVSTREAVAAFRWHPDSLTVANRSSSVAEAELVKRRHLPAPLRPLSPLWHLPVRWATHAAARGVSRRARRVGTEASATNL